jgi:SdpC family antimicrobial peptide
MRQHIQAALMASVVFLTQTVGCGSPPGQSSPPPSDQNATTTVAATTYDGETILKGALFGYGPAAPVFEEVWGGVTFRPLDKASSPEEYAAASASIDKVFDRIRVLHPGALEEFASAATTGDHVIIDEEFRKLLGHFGEAAAVEFPATGPSVNGGAHGDCIWLAFAGIVAVAVTLALAANVQLAYNRTFAWTRPDPQSKTGTPITSDMVVDAMALHLRK